MNTYVIEQFVEETTTEVVGVRLTLEAAQALCDEIVDQAESHGSRDWKIDWREDTASTQHDRSSELRTWTAHRPTMLWKGYSTYLFVHITEHLTEDAAA